MVNPDGTGATGIPNSAASDVQPAWSADGTKFAFSTNVSPPREFPNYEIYTMNADGTGRTRITNYADSDATPAWSPDGTKIAFTRNLGAGLFSQIFTINADGTGETQITPAAGDGNAEPAWSPDGTKIAFVRNFGDIWTMNPDGTGAVNVTNTPGKDKAGPNWSPDGTKIAFTQNDDPNTIDCEVSDWEIHTVNADGTDDARITNNVALDSEPAWSPDGTKIAFFTYRDEPDPVNCTTTCNFAIYTMSATGASPTRLVAGSAPDWQPIPYTGYPRPRGASPLRISLVPAYKACTAPNRTHGSPLSFPSCNPPQQQSGSLTIGTPDANGQGAKSTPYVRFGVKAQAPADVRIRVSIGDVRKKSDLSDYSGELLEQSVLRATDHDNGVSSPGGADAATMTDVNLPITVPCAATPDTTIGGQCDLGTTMNAVIPGSVTGGDRAVWELSQAQVFDGGPDGAVGTQPNTLFLDEGIFIP